MDREVAKSIMELALSMDPIIGKMYGEVSKISDENLKKNFGRAVDDLMGYIARNIIFPIEKEHPDLKEA